MTLETERESIFNVYCLLLFCSVRGSCRVCWPELVFLCCYSDPQHLHSHMQMDLQLTMVNVFVIGLDCMVSKWIGIWTLCTVSEMECVSMRYWERVDQNSESQILLLSTFLFVKMFQKPCMNESFTFQVRYIAFLQLSTALECRQAGTRKVCF